MNAHRLTDLKTIIKRLSTVLVFSLLASFDANAGYVSGKIVNISIDMNGYGYVTFDHSLTGGASCGTGYPSSLAVNTNTAGGRTILATALAAKNTNATISATGTAACTIYGSVEDWYYGTMQ